jgi:hypothetical protein
MKAQLLTLDGTVEHDPSIEAWWAEHAGELGAMARVWWDLMRGLGDEVRELLHDGCPVACLGEFPFGYVNVFRAHANVGFFQGAALRDPARLLEGTGSFMRHVKLRPGAAVDTEALRDLIETAFVDMRARVEHG